MLNFIRNIKIKTYKKKTLQEERRRTTYTKICSLASHPLFTREEGPIYSTKGRSRQAGMKCPCPARLLHFWKENLCKSQLWKEILSCITHTRLLLKVHKIFHVCVRSLNWKVMCTFGATILENHVLPSLVRTWCCWTSK
jgi:hypothetical protein